jgi:hypothetical protein
MDKHNASTQPPGPADAQALEHGKALSKLARPAGTSGLWRELGYVWRQADREPKR